MKAKLKYRMISWVAEKYDVHPQTLRLWEREGLLTPTRSRGNTRLYDEDACEQLESILTLTRDLGVNLAYQLPGLLVTYQQLINFVDLGHDIE